MQELQERSDQSSHDLPYIARLSPRKFSGRNAGEAREDVGGDIGRVGDRTGCDQPLDPLPWADLLGCRRLAALIVKQLGKRK